MGEPGKYNNTLKYVGLGTQMMALMGLGVWGGIKLDSLTNWKFPLFVITLPLLALGVSLWQLLRESNKPKK